jgi:hypothetical protein
VSRRVRKATKDIIALWRLKIKLYDEQGGKCAMRGCDRTDLVFDHDHNHSLFGDDEVTLENGRAWVCNSCNYHLRLYEQGTHYLGDWSVIDTNISTSEYEQYMARYERRLVRYILKKHYVRHQPDWDWGNKLNKWARSILCEIYRDRRIKRMYS